MCLGCCHSDRNNLRSSTEWLRTIIKKNAINLNFSVLSGLKAINYGFSGREQQFDKFTKSLCVPTLLLCAI